MAFNSPWQLKHSQTYVRQLQDILEKVLLLPDSDELQKNLRVQSLRFERIRSEFLRDQFKKNQSRCQARILLVRSELKQLGKLEDTHSDTTAPQLITVLVDARSAQLEDNINLVEHRIHQQMLTSALRESLVQISHSIQKHKNLESAQQLFSADANSPQAS